ncbi:MAG TPA: hypothetical protein VFZ59_22210 [Verrucomicrobiae bacterium]|nr:hypothetical protein [Verrucomicrobiae bacterium]
MNDIMTNTNNDSSSQLELGLQGARRVTRIARRENRMARAAWWFGKMREVVNGAVDWQSLNQPRPEQILLPGAYRQVKV